MTTILTITGSDGTGGSGIQADIKTITALGGYAVSAITTITTQNTLGIQDFYDLPSATVGEQIDAIMNDMQPTIVKVGMLRTTDTVAVVVDALSRYRPQFVIYDPIVTASNGDRLMTDDIISQIRCRLLPLCSLIVLRDEHVRSALNLGEADKERAIMVTDLAHHGFANGFSSAVAVYLSQGEVMDEAIAKAREYVRTVISRSMNLQSRSSQLYDDFLEIVRSHCRTNRDVAFYADCLNVSARYLAQVTHRICGLTPKRIIDQNIIDSIRRELSTTRRNIQEIAYDMGFATQAQFSKFFKKETGISPSAFRADHKNGGQDRE